MSMKSIFTDAFVVLAIISLLGGGVYLWKLKRELSSVKSHAEFILKERNEFEAASLSMQNTIDRLKADAEAADASRTEKVVTEIQIKEVVKERLVYVDRVVASDPVLNKRELSPVLKDTISRIQQSRKAESQ